MNLESLIQELRAFVAQRDWAQFHSPKNLCMALSVEVAELMEPFQWLTQEESERLGPGKLEHVREELADVFIYLILLADRLGIDLLDAAGRKLAENHAKYPPDRARGNAAKYTEHGM